MSAIVPILLPAGSIMVRPGQAWTVSIRGAGIQIPPSYGCSVLVVVVDGLASEQAAAEPAQQLMGVQTEPLEQVSVLVGVDLVGELLFGLVGALLVAALAQEVQDHVLVELHAISFVTCDWLTRCAGRLGSGVLPRRPVPFPSSAGIAARSARPLRPELVGRAGVRRRVVSGRRLGGLLRLGPALLGLGGGALPIALHRL